MILSLKTNIVINIVSNITTLSVVHFKIRTNSLYLIKAGRLYSDWLKTNNTYLLLVNVTLSCLSYYIRLFNRDFLSTNKRISNSDCKEALMFDGDTTFFLS